MRTIKTKKLMSSQHNVLPPATEIPFTSFDGKMPNPLIIYIVSLRAGNPKKSDIRNPTIFIKESFLHSFIKIVGFFYKK